jgi:hypothetical protein
MLIEEDIKSRFKSNAYEHFVIGIERVKALNGGPGYINVTFTCKIDPDHHPIQRRKRMDTSSGTGNLIKSIKNCDERLQGLGKPRAQQDLHQAVSKYTPEGHRVIISLRCSASKRPFNIVNDPMYKWEVNYLRPGTSLPSVQTISRDTTNLYCGVSEHVKKYLKVLFIYLLSLI